MKSNRSLIMPGVFVVILISGIWNIAPLAISASAKEENPSLSFQLPQPHKSDMKGTLKCKAIASVSLHQNAGDPDRQNILIAEARPGTDKLELTLVNDTLLVRVGDSGTDRYTVTGNTNYYLSAVFKGGLVPVIDSIVMEKDKGLAVWTISEPADVFTDVPYAQSVYFACQ